LDFDFNRLLANWAQYSDHTELKSDQDSDVSRANISSNHTDLGSDACVQLRSLEPAGWYLDIWSVSQE
jgi:hypothetical protein